MEQRTITIKWTQCVGSLEQLEKDMLNNLYFSEVWNVNTVARIFQQSFTEQFCNKLTGKIMV